jgi:hypothetical protein
MAKHGIVSAFLIFATCAFASPLIPTKPGTTWQYNMTQEVGEGLRLSNVKPDADGKIRTRVTYHIAGIQNVEDKDLIEFEMHRDGVVTNTDLVTVDDHGITCWGKINVEGELIELDPPQTMMVGEPIKTGQNWNFEAQVANLKVSQRFEVADQEEIQVPAGKFSAFRIHGEQTTPTATTIDRWFVPGVGIVKDVTTMRSKEGDILQRISLELRENPKIEKRPEVKAMDPPKKLSASLATDPKGDPRDEFSAQTPKIYARWEGRRLREHAKVRVVWIAEKVEDVPADYKVDEASAFADGKYSHGHFILSRPEDDFEPGEYRAEFYVDDVLQETLKLKITK